VLRTATLLGFSHSTVSLVYQEWSTTQRTSNLTQLWEELEPKWAIIPVKCFRHLVESMPWLIEAVLRAKAGATQYSEGVPNVLYTQCILVTHTWIHTQTEIIYMAGRQQRAGHAVRLGSEASVLLSQRNSMESVAFPTSVCECVVFLSCVCVCFSLCVCACLQASVHVCMYSAESEGGLLPFRPFIPFRANRQNSD
jgi:hypothetical protein